MSAESTPTNSHVVVTVFGSPSSLDIISLLKFLRLRG